MDNHEMQDFTKLLEATMDMYGQNASEMTYELWFSILGLYPYSIVKKAFYSYLKDGEKGRFSPKPGDIKSIIQEMDGRIGPEEAWALVPKTAKETVVWTEEMAYAWGIAEPLLKAGNEVSARMTFKETYLKLVKEARNSEIPAKWSVSIGEDRVSMTTAITRAKEAGRISEEYAATLLGAPAPSNAPRLGGPNALGDGIAKVLENCVKNSRHSEVAIREMAKIRKILGMPERGHSEVKPERKLLHPVKDAETINTALDAMARTYPTGKAENDVKTAVIEQSIDDLIAESWNDGTWPRGDIEYYRAYAQADYNRKQGKKAQ